MYRWPRVLVMAIGVLLATALLASAPLLVDTVVSFGLLHTLSASDPLTGNLRLTLHTYPDPASVANLDRRVRASVGTYIDHLATRVISSIESPGLYPWIDGEMVTDQRVTLRLYENLLENTELVAGGWPKEPLIEENQLAVVVSEAMADAYALGVGDVLPLGLKRDETTPMASFTVAGIIRPTQWRDPYWFGIYGPLQPYHDGRWTAEHNVFVSQDAFYAIVPSLVPQGNLTLNWHILIEPESIAEAAIADTRTAVETLQRDLEGGIRESSCRPPSLTCWLPMRSRLLWYGRRSHYSQPRSSYWHSTTSRWLLHW